MSYEIIIPKLGFSMTEEMCIRDRGSFQRMAEL